MKTLIKNSIKYFGLLILLAASVCWTGCEVFTRHSSPLVGWKIDLDHEPDKTIVKDWQDYIQKLPPKERTVVGPFFYFEDGTGQHAVDVDVSIQRQNASWHYAFIYDKENRRVKVIKYGYTRYQS